MLPADIISWAMIPIGIIACFKPVRFIYCLAALPVIWSVPYLSTAVSGFKIATIGSIDVYDLDYFFILFSTTIFLITFNTVFVKRHSLGIYLSSPISKMVFVLFLWDLFLAALSYQKGFQLQNILRVLSREVLLFIAVFIPIVARPDIKKDTFLKFTILLGSVLTTFALVKLGITNEIEYTSSGTVRTLLGNNVVILMLPICYLLFYSSYHRDYKFASWVIIAFIALGINFTGHRSGWIALIFTIMIYILSHEFNMKDFIWIPLLGISVILTASVFILPHLALEGNKSIVGDMVIRISDTLDLNNRTTQERLSKWLYSYEIAKENPLIGLGRFPVYTESLEKQSKLAMFSEFNRSPHNFVADVIAHQGICGFLVVLLFLGVLFHQLKYLKHQNQRYASFLTTYILSFLLFSLFNTSFSAASGKLYFAIVLGFINAETIRLKAQARSFQIREYA